VAATAVVALVAALTTVGNASGATASDRLAAGITTTKLSGAHETTAGPRGVLPRSGKVAFLLKLDVKSTGSVYTATKNTKGAASAHKAARAQLGTVRSSQQHVIADLPDRSSVLYRTHASLAGVAVLTDVKNYRALHKIGGVSDVYPIAAKKPSNAYAVPYQGGAAAWQAYGERGENATVAIIDTGVDYTHANFGGPGTRSAYETALQADTEVPQPGSYDPAKFNATTTDINGGLAYMHDFAGDDYDANPDNDTYQPVPHPDPNPLDCGGHGSHVAGTVAGFGEWGNGETYDGAYNKNTPFDQLRIGPGVAPMARLYVYRVFGCAGSTNVTGEAVDKAMDPNGDGDTSDHADVVNMSLGSDYGYPDDGDSVLANEASEIAGVTMVIASGNGGDIYDIGGSPGDAPRALTVASSQDASSVVDALNVTINGTAHRYPSERSAAYDWETKADLSGQVVKLAAQPGNEDGCLALDAAARAQVTGKVAFVEWDDNDATRHCGSVARSGNLAAAGAIGFVFGSNEESFTAGISGSTVIPGVLVAKSGADALRTAIVAAQPVHVTGTTYGGVAQLDTSLNDMISDFSSRGIRDAGNVKPDVTAIGSSVWSTGMGTGNLGSNDSGTSMATPMVAGTAALVTSKHPDWTPEQVKADIMNTANADLYHDPSQTGSKYAPNRVGSGRIDIKAALDNSVLAYTTDGPGGTGTGVVSASWGPLALPVNSGPWTGSKTITLQNTGQDAATYAATFKDRTTIPGVTYSVSPSVVTVQPHQKATVTLTLTIEPGQLTKTIDKTVDRVTGSLPRQYVADASGIVLFQNQATKGTNLRVPAFAAPRPASVMTQPATLTMPSGSVQKTLLPLSGTQVHQVDGKNSIQSLVAGFELQATSGALPHCTSADQTGCWDIPDQRAADLKYVGVTTDAPQLTSAGEDPMAEGEVYFAITGQAAARHPVSPSEVDVYVDSNGDRVPDAVAFTTRVPASTSDTDIMVTAVQDLNTGNVELGDALNASLGDTDTAIFDSDTYVMPVPLSLLPGLAEDNPRINYAVFSFDGYHSAPLDSVGDIDENFRIVRGLSMDVLHPGVSVQGSYDGTSSPILFHDSPGTVLSVERDVPAYRTDHGLGALMIHFHNGNGTKAQVVTFTRATPAVKLSFSPATVRTGKSTTVTVTVTGSAGPASGVVTVNRLNGAKPGPIGTVTLANGTASFTYTPPATGTFNFTATYGGDSIYTGGTSPIATVRHCGLC
jgi:subtilisin family serine protease